jgi:hypothetical protein
VDLVNWGFGYLWIWGFGDLLSAGLGFVLVFWGFGELGIWGFGDSAAKIPTNHQFFTATTRSARFHC